MVNFIIRRLAFMVVSMAAISVISFVLIDIAPGSALDTKVAQLRQSGGDVSAEAGAVTQKALLPLPNGETLIGRVIRQYAEAGFRQFVALPACGNDAENSDPSGGAVGGRCQRGGTPL